MSASLKRTAPDHVDDLPPKLQKTETPSLDSVATQVLAIAVRILPVTQSLIFHLLQVSKVFASLCTDDDLSWRRECALAFHCFPNVLSEVLSRRAYRLLVGGEDSASYSTIYQFLTSPMVSRWIFYPFSSESFNKINFALLIVSRCSNVSNSKPNVVIKIVYKF